jgi:hypothetical protein
MFITMKITIPWDVTSCSPDITSILEELSAYIIRVEEHEYPCSQKTKVTVSSNTL